MYHKLKYIMKNNSKTAQFVFEHTHDDTSSLCLKTIVIEINLTIRFIQQRLLCFKFGKTKSWQLYARCTKKADCFSNSFCNLNFIISFGLRFFSFFEYNTKIFCFYAFNNVQCNLGVGGRADEGRRRTTKHSQSDTDR